MNKQNKGITLIALVITIVVLVILVGVSVSVTINTGLIANSKKAVADYDSAQQDEQAEIKKVEDIMNSMDQKSLAAKVKVGDYVKYTPKSGEEYTTYTSYKGDYEGCIDEEYDSELLYQKTATINVEGEATGSGTQGNGYGEQTFTVPEDTSDILWRVLSIENGKVNLVSETEMGRNGVWTGDWENDTLYLSGITGYAYGEEEINEVCKIYGYGEGAEGARSITIEDVNKITGYVEEEGTVDGWAEGYSWENTDYYYEYNEEGLNTADKSKTPYSLIFKGSVDESANYWLASRCVLADIECGAFNMRCLYPVDANEAWVTSFDLFAVCPITDEGYDLGIMEYNCPVRPVVTLKSTVKAGTSTTDANGLTTWEMVVPTES